MIWFDNHQAYVEQPTIMYRVFMNWGMQLELEMTGIDDSVTIKDDPKAVLDLEQNLTRLSDILRS